MRFYCLTCNFALISLKIIIVSYNAINHAQFMVYSGEEAQTKNRLSFVAHFHKMV